MSLVLHGFASDLDGKGQFLQKNSKDWRTAEREIQKKGGFTIIKPIILPDLNQITAPPLTAELISRN